MGVSAVFDDATFNMNLSPSLWGFRNLIQRYWAVRDGHVLNLDYMDRSDSRSKSKKYLVDFERMMAARIKKQKEIELL